MRHFIPAIGCNSAGGKEEPSAATLKFPAGLTRRPLVVARRARTVPSPGRKGLAGAGGNTYLK